jgi:hypothetical protein
MRGFLYVLSNKARSSGGARWIWRGSAPTDLEPMAAADNPDGQSALSIRGSPFRCVVVHRP